MDKARWFVEVATGGIVGHLVFQVARHFGFDGFFSVEAWVATVCLVALATTPRKEQL